MKIAEVLKQVLVSRQAIFISIKSGRLKADKIGGRWNVDQENIDKYLEERYSRKYSKHNGKFLFNNAEGRISVNDAAKIIGVDKGHVYHAIRYKKLNPIRMGCAYVLNLEEVKMYKPNLKRGRKCSQNSLSS